MLKHNEIKNGIKGKYLKKSIKLGLPLPSIRELAEKFDVSKETIRKIINELKKEKVIYGKRGCGLFPVQMADSSGYDAPASLPGTEELFKRSFSKPVLKFMVVDNRADMHFAEIVSDFNKNEKKFRVEISYANSVEQSLPPGDFDIVVAPQHNIYLWNKFLNFPCMETFHGNKILSFLDEMQPIAQNAVSYSEKIFCLPVYFSLYMIFTRKGFSNGCNGRQTVRWEDFLAKCKDECSRRKDIIAPVLPGIFAFFFSSGIWPDFSKPWAGFSPGSLEKTILEIQDYFMLFPESLNHYEYVREESAMIKHLAEGITPYYPSFTGVLRSISGMRVELTAFPPPIGARKVFGSLGMGAINPDSLRPDASAKFLLHLASPESQRVIAVNGMDLPCRKDRLELSCPDRRRRNLYSEVFSYVPQTESLYAPDNPYADFFLRKIVSPEIYLYITGEASLDETVKSILDSTRDFSLKMDRIYKINSIASAINGKIVSVCA